MNLRQRIKNSNSLRIGHKKFSFAIATSVQVHLVTDGGDVHIPNARPIIEVHCNIHIYNPERMAGRRGRRGTRRMYFNPETEAFTRTPNGKKGWDIELDNKPQIVEFILESLAGV